MGEPRHAPTTYRGHVVSVTLKDGKRLAKVMVDDVGPHYKEVFWVDRNNIPEWLGKGMGVTFWLVQVGSSDGGEIKRIAINVLPQE